MEKYGNTPNENIRYYVNYSMTGASVIFIVLLVLKLCGVINCGWWVVFLPLIIPFFLSVLFMLTFWAALRIFYYIWRKKR